MVERVERADRWRIGRLWLGCSRRRRQLRHEEGLRGRARSPGQYNFYWHENDYGGPGPETVKLRDVIQGRAATNPAEFALPDDSVTDGEGKELFARGWRQQWRRPRQHHGLCLGVRVLTRCCSAIATIRPARSTRRDRWVRRSTSGPAAVPRTNAIGRFTDFLFDKNSYNFTTRWTRQRPGVPLRCPLTSTTSAR